MGRRRFTTWHIFLEEILRLLLQPPGGPTVAAADKLGSLPLEADVTLRWRGQPQRRPLPKELAFLRGRLRRLTEGGGRCFHFHFSWDSSF